MLRLILNIVWLLLAGIELAVAYALAGLVMMVTIIGIPFGVQAFKLAGFALWPFGRAVVPNPDSSVVASTIGNLIWVVLAGWWLALAHLLAGVVLCLTIIGIPLGIASFKMVGMALWPFGRRVVDRATLGSLPPGSYTVGSKSND
ncbi:MAG: YccF domain-containing protein [Actinobacteria bacterium]|nr:YccF domain-containing protein [Actinomycetota bacterium]MCI0678246.1 YccF domain-containing protein [Actinomycetota bacterium]